MICKDVDFEMGGTSDNIFFQFILIIVLILSNAFFAASEMAIVSLNKNKITLLANEGNPKAELLLSLLKEPSRFLATIQVGITFAGFLASASAATTISKYLAAFMKRFAIPASEQISLILITIFISFLTLVLGELFPKRVALQSSDSIALAVAKPILMLSKITLPFVKLLTASTNFLVRVFGINLENLEEKVSEEEIRMMINVGEENGVINETEKEMLDGIFEFDDTLAREIMTPRTNVFALDINLEKEKIIDRIIEEQYSRVPIYEDDTDNIIGILYMKDIFTFIRNNSIKDLDIKSLLRPAYFVPEIKNIDTLFKELQSSKNYMAILIDEYGGFSGIVTMEDLIEEVMGNIFDEHDVKDEDIIQLDNNTYLVNGMTYIDDINELLDSNIPTENYDTLGGFIISLLGTIPKSDEEHTVEYDNLTFKVEKVNEKRIEKIKIYKT
jgi:putative hemolysin